VSNPNDGGPAFPVAENHKVAADVPWTQGMTLRDWFAGQALVGMLGDSSFDAPEDRLAAGAYAMADAMLRARDVEP